MPRVKFMLQCRMQGRLWYWRGGFGWVYEARRATVYGSLPTCRSVIAEHNLKHTTIVEIEP